MKKFLWIVFVMFSASASGQQDTNNMLATARTFMRDGDYSNALLVLNKAREQQPDNLDVLRDIAYTYYLQRDYVKAKQTINPLMEREDADVATFQVGGNIYKATEELKDCERIYKDGLKKFPQSGALYSEYGELLMARKDPLAAIESWEKGIETDPSHPGCYYQASRYYYYNGDKVWSLVYGEIFINLESYSQKTAEIKGLLLEAYKKFFILSDASNGYDNKKKNPFEEAFLTTLRKQSSLAGSGISADNLVMIRTRFILDWFETRAARFPFRLFDYHQQLLKDGMFEAYNQWIFGTVNDPIQYQNWTKTHPDQYNQFNYFQHNRVFKMPPGQYYQTKP